mmetsp:Transcript_9453/g.17055  ORF Transcript_9453/g.17055 Transcript_9453/m.17055 type:complete len:389 (-) Transcript_9453:92-1258(-)|eukprot:CAMPEP_0201604412 /NCGR_PEP_ID=MMETSP0492-20130828/4562_1 /ASSEMBLY_ACC=CAM_ASM_000837 /TAXON_ID=420259 /ORGANISM="Thalassiosira gravida, Strain GMp14c1" /LENGTH=388 /DNA_ID=CAMNT_0048068437 /DNA_START=125 /DNA_END=1291 /DNA_ORIENTATION=-
MASSNGNPFQWLGLLKWSLAYSDGTRPSDDIKPMNKDDIEFLEKVMKEGIIDEGERMKSILKDLTDSLEMLLGANITADGNGDGGRESKQEEKRKELDEDDMLELLQELRDIVEQIDYARAFMAMGGIPFLLGCATYQTSGNDSATDRTIPKSIRKGVLGVLSTMCQNNPPVQLSLLEHGHIPQLIQLFLDYTPGNDCGNEGNDPIREKAVQALSASIRGHAMAEHIFCQNKEGMIMLQIGLGMQQQKSNTTSKPSAQLRKRTLFLLRALLTSDDATNERHAQFEKLISFTCTHVIDERWEEDAEIREMGLAMVSQLLRHTPKETDPSSTGAKVSKIILQHMSHIGLIGVERIGAIRNLKEGSEDWEYATMELEEWETLMVALVEASK